MSKGNTSFYLVIGLFFAAVLLTGCTSDQASASRMDAPDSVAQITLPTSAIAASPSVTPQPSTTPLSTATPPPTVTPQPSATSSPTPFPTDTPSPSSTATPIGPCSERIPSDNLLTLVTRSYPISRNYTPSDLVALADFFPMDITLGYPTEVREVMARPLQDMIAAMQATGLQPFVISGYRSYSAQVIAREKWASQFPDWVDNISAQPGTSEHQLGTTVDLGSPELPDIVGEEEIQFHTYFYQTSEGQWLLEHAHEFGFTLSYPRDTLELTGFYYEPWHYRYVGVDLATMLKEQELTLTAHLLESYPVPCVP